jgi:hypothetical protein
LNDGSISEKTISIITRLLPPDSWILELGSGEGTQALHERGYNMISIEHDKEWLNKYNTHYIHAPIEHFKPTKQFIEFEFWYCHQVLARELSALEYDLLLVDGPPRRIESMAARVGRAGLFKYREFFNWDVPVIFDDTQREAEWKIAYQIARRLDGGRPLYTYDTGQRKMATLMLPDKQMLEYIKDLL